MAKVGYARVSSTGQKLEIQLDKLKHCEKVFYEKKSGTSTKARTKWRECMQYLRKGDTLVITKLDRLARSLIDLTAITAELEKKEVELVVLDQKMDTSTPEGKLLFHMLGAVAEFETQIRAERQRDGIAKALAKGTRFGAKAKLTPEQLTAMRKKRADGVLIRELMAEYGISKATVYRLLKE
jgi:DNA invertase Pin-like site-specific DNA recombinase